MRIELSAEQLIFIFQPVSEAEVRGFLSWRYAPPYDLYNLDTINPDDELAYFLNPNNRFYSIINESGDLLAFCSFGLDAQVPGGDYGRQALDLGLGIRPDLTGQGQGVLYANAVVAFARRTFAPPAYRVTVAGWNKRARRVWEKAGFQWVETFNNRRIHMPFDILIKEETA
jgi:RimJ/RimL family protein N-acetyltransferase